MLCGNLPGAMKSPCLDIPVCSKLCQTGRRGLRRAALPIPLAPGLCKVGAAPVKTLIAMALLSNLEPATKSASADPPVHTLPCVAVRPGSQACSSLCACGFQWQIAWHVLFNPSRLLVPVLYGEMDLC